MAPAGTSDQLLEFPLDWRGRILTRATDTDVPAQITRVLRGFGLHADPARGNASSGGAYVTYTVAVTIGDREMLQHVTYALSRLKGVHMVL